MTTALTTAQQSTVIDILHTNSSGISINPFEKEIFLKSFLVSGTQFGEDLRALSVKISKGTEIKFIRELDNGDEFSIRVEGIGRKLGYVPASVNEIPAHLMDAGKMIFGKVNRCSLSYSGVDILVDMYMKG